MGDRPYVNLQLPIELAERAKEIFEAHGDSPEDESTIGEGKLLAWFGFSEVNYGELPFLADLQQAGIPYDSAWDDGGDYSSGTEHCRFTPEGEIEVRQIYDADLNPDLHHLLDRLENHESLKRYILEHKERVTPRSWDDQVEYGKRYRAKQLINPQK